MTGEVVDMQEHFKESSIVDENLDISAAKIMEEPEPLRPRAALAFMEVIDIVAASFGENGKRCYKVHWKDSWVYDDHLFDCEDLIEQFWTQQPEKNDQVKIVGSCPTKRVGEILSPKKDSHKRLKPNDDVTVIVMSDNHNNTHNNSDDGNNQDVDLDWMQGEDQVSEDPKDADWTNDSENKPKRQQQQQHMTQLKKRDLFTCHICGEEFDMVASIRRHYTENHPGAKPFACDVCGKRFDRKENLNRHIRIHTGDRRYVCNHCGKGYTDPSGLKKHVLSKHSTSSFPCNVCDATFKLKDSLNRHLTRHLSDLKDKKDIDSILNKPVDSCASGDEQSVFIPKTNSSLNSPNLLPTQADLSTKSSHKSNQLQEVISVQQLQQYADSGAVQVQYIQVSHDLSPGQTVMKDDEKENKDMLSESEKGEQETFVIPITAQNILSLTSPQNISATSPMVVNAQHMINIPVTGPNNLEYNENIKLAEPSTEI